MILQEKQIKLFQKKILDWYTLNKRDLPWRNVPVGISLQQRAYRILVTEIMLQQTQVSRVIPKYNAWLEVFPTVDVLAKAATSEVLRMWSGLGYNRRALLLQKTAKKIIGEYKGEWPMTLEGLKMLPGVGEYTARAIACFAFNKQVAVVDVNVKKVVLLELFSSKGRSTRTLSDKEIQHLAEQLLPEGRAYDWNQALMDYASSVLKKEKIPSIKQSTFRGSRRYYRGKLVKLLLERECLPENDVYSQLRDEHIPKNFDMNVILADLEKEGFIKREKGTVELVK